MKRFPLAHNVTPLFGTDGLPLGEDANDCGDPPAATVTESETETTGGGGKGKALGHNK